MRTQAISPPILSACMEKRIADIANAENDRTTNQPIGVSGATREVVKMSDVTIYAMVNLAETRDNETGNHIRRTQHYVAALARELKDHPRFHDLLTEENIEPLYKSAPLHDIGKVGVPDNILLKPGKLDGAEFAIMEKHMDYGRDTVIAVENYLDERNGFLTFAREIAYGIKKSEMAPVIPRACPETIFQPRRA